MANMRITVLNEGKTSDEVLALLKAIVIAKSNSDLRTSQVLDASFSIGKVLYPSICNDRNTHLTQ